MEQYIPGIGLLIVFVLFRWAHFENQRWTRARAQGLRGESEVFGALVDLTGLFASLFGWGFLIAFAALVDWRQALGLVVIGFLCWMPLGIISRDNPITWIVGTMAVWILAILLVYLGFFAG